MKDAANVIRAAYGHLTANESESECVKLAPLRSMIREVLIEEGVTFSRDEIDAEIVAMQARGEAVLYPIDGLSRHDKCNVAAALTVAGERRDILFIRP